MKKAILAVVIALLIAIVGVLGFAATKPDTFEITRSATIGAPPAVVFPHVNDFQKWRGWSPWENLDPNLKRTYSEKTAGEGATYAWVGNSQAGEGKMTITESRPNERIVLKLDFVKPMQATNKVEFLFKPEGDGTNVSWTMDGENAFIGKVFAVFVNMDAMVGGSFEQGLASLKAVAEKEAAQS